MTAATSLPEWLRPTPTTPALQRTIRVAFLGRTSTDDQQDPTLSIPRQLTNCERALLPTMRIVLRFYDVETSRKELDQRGSSTAWKKFNIPVDRDGGIADMLAEATAPDRRFDVVICESIDRIARFTYQGTKIEHDLELAGVPLLAADEPIIFDGPTAGRKRKRASQILLRRTKQGVAEWYIVEMLEKSWDGFEIHTTQGWNVGKPPYGYTAERHKHPVPAKRAEGKHKTKLAIDPIRAPAVQQIFAWRVDEALSYRAIAERLNIDLDRYPPPQPADPERAVGHWTGSAVREILCNPKYTGHMCWNRRSTKDKIHPGKNNPKEAWILSAEPTHPELVSVTTFVAAQNVASGRERSRSDARPGAPNPHRQTKQVYRLRSYVHCVLCQRRMHGKAKRTNRYYYCQPRERTMPEGHPPTIWLPERDLLDGATRFFNTHVFGPDRVALVSHSIATVNVQTLDEHRQRIDAVTRALEDTGTRLARLALILEQRDDPDGSLFDHVQQRTVELKQELATRKAELEHLQQTAPDSGPGPIALLDELPHLTVDVAGLPVERVRRLFDAFAVQIHYDHLTNRATYRAHISADILPNLADAANTAAAISANTAPRQRQPRHDGPADHSGAVPHPRRSSVTCPAGGTSKISQNGT